MKKLISIILCMAMLAGVLAFAGCKNNKDNQDTTAASTGIDAVDAADTTEPSADSTAAESSTAKETKPSGRPTQTVPAAARPKRRLSLSRSTRPRSPTTAAPPVGTARATTNAAAEAASSLPANIILSRPLQTTPRSSGTARKKMTKVSPSPMT